MNKKLFFAMLGGMALVMPACSSDEPAINGGDNGNTDGEKYMAVRISTAGIGGSRGENASDFNGFEGPADNKEGAVTEENIRFYFFNDKDEPFVMSMTGVNGEVSNTNMVKPTTIAHNNTDGEAGTIDAVLVLNGYKGNKPAKVFCVANAHALSFESYANKPLSEIEELSANVSATDWTTFTMTSSTYVDGNVIKYWSDIEDGNITTTAAAAKTNPVDIYIERLAVKVRASGLGTYTAQARNGKDGTLSDATYIIRALDGQGNATSLTNKNLTVELTGWRILNTPQKSYAVKKLQDGWITNPPFTGWNEATKHRSYWAYSIAAGSDDLTNKSYNIKSTTQFSLGNFATTAPTQNIQYCYEFTRSDAKATTSVSDRKTNATAIIVRGIVKLDNAPADLCEWGGDMFTTARLKKVIADAYNKDFPGSTKTADDVSFRSKSDVTKANRYVASIKVGEDNYEPYTRFDNIAWWDNGQTSYRVNIDHQTVTTTTGEGDAVTTTTTHNFGVVRNHIYDYTFTNVVGLGVPGNETENPEPLTETYLAARLNVLNWHIVSNKIVLE